MLITIEGKNEFFPNPRPSRACALYALLSFSLLYFTLLHNSRLLGGFLGGKRFFLGGKSSFRGKKKKSLKLGLIKYIIRHD